MSHGTMHDIEIQLASFDEETELFGMTTNFLWDEAGWRNESNGHELAELQAIHTRTFFRDSSAVHGIPWLQSHESPVAGRTGFGIFPAQAKHIPSKGECVKVIGQAYADRPTGAINTEKHHQPLHMGVSENSVPLIPMVNDHYPY